MSSKVQLLFSSMLILSLHICTVFLLLNRAHRDLCPVTGYHGSFCPDTRTQFHSRKRIASSSIPHAVGMTIDLSTGEIKLPALKLTYSAQSKLPDEANVTTADNIEHSEPNVYVFRTEEDFIHLWDQQSGSWIGGELGHVKGLLQMYNHFFAENQATAIIQHLYPLYILEMDLSDTIPTLNQHAQQAVDQLPSAYNAEKYRHFIDTWGTHIAVKTELGGMREQQILFKRCIWQSQYFTGGLTESDFELRLKQDFIAPATINNSYLEERWKIILDHLIGGDVNVSDFDQWQETLSYSPALLRILKYISWLDIVPNSTIKTNLQTAMADRIRAASVTRIAEIDLTRRQRLATLFFTTTGTSRRGSWSSRSNSSIMGNRECNHTKRCTTMPRRLTTHSIKRKMQHWYLYHILEYSGSDGAIKI